MSGKSYLRNRNYHKYNYFDAFKYIVPGYMYEDDIDHTPKGDDLVDVIINSNINLANNFSSVIYVSAIDDTASENLDNVSGIAPFFVKQNKITDITTQEFEDNILYPLGKSFSDYETVESFSSYVDEDLLPAIKLNNPSGFSSTDTSNSHNYLINNLSWLYFLNTSGSTYDPSSYVSDVIVNKLYKGEDISTADGIKGLMEYVWKDGLTQYYPSAYFASGSRSDLSGTQQLDNLKTWIDIIYSPLFSDNSDFRVRDKFDTFLDSSITTTRKIEDGPFARFLKALSFLAYDIDDLSEQLTTIYDLEDCPDEYLPLLAKLIGWDLFGTDPMRWRLQLRNAVQIYKAVGTKKSIQFAVNTIFPKDRFPIQSSIVELWESYVPYLIFYALATESKYFEDFTTWTPALALSMNVKGYSASSMEDNLRRATDRIIYETYQQFSGSFNIPNIEDGFEYRGEIHELPPFEEYPYYVNVELNKKMIDFIADRLVCFGVRDKFAVDVSGYMTEYGLDSNDEPRDGSWLLFTSGYNEPSNFDEMITQSNSKKVDYLSMWSGKSSHFKLAVNASAYDFTRQGLITPDTGNAVEIAAQMTRKFAPAHSIPLISLQISDTDGVLPADDPYYLPLIMFNFVESEVAANDNYFMSGLNINSYKRDVNTGGTILTRDDTKTNVATRLSGATYLGNIPRRSVRRRSYQNVMPFNGYYDRTGFNMPVPFENDDSLSGLPLGYIPTKGTYVPVSSHVNLPDVWDQCEDLGSKNSYNNYAVSDTMPARGKAFYLSSVFNDRGKLPEVYAAMHRIMERDHLAQYYHDHGPTNIEREIKRIEGTTLTLELLLQLLDLRDQLNLLPEWTWIGGANSYKNSNVSGYTFPQTADDYYNFEFGRDLQKLHRIYVEDYQQHQLSPKHITLDGPNIVSHAFGPLLYNHDFDLLFENNLISSIITSSLNSVKELKAGISPFTTASSYVASGPNDMYLEQTELVFSSLVKGVELIHTSANDFDDPDDSSLSVFKISRDKKKPEDDPYMYNRTFIMIKGNRKNLPRVRMDISKWDVGSEYPLNTNFLLPDCEYEINLNALIGDKTGRKLGGRSVGIWIHTKPEDSKMWSYTPDGKWVQHTALPTRSDTIQKYSHIFNYPSVTKNLTNNFQCLDVVAGEVPLPVTKYAKDDFLNFNVRFNTNNLKLIEPVDYKVNIGDLHRTNQEYVVELFLVPSPRNIDSFLVFDEVVMQNLTLKRMTERYVAGTRTYPLVWFKAQNYKDAEVRTELSKQDLVDIFLYYNQLTRNDASRDESLTSAIMGTNGGSRLTYRYKLDWFAPTLISNTLDGVTIDV